MAKKRYYGGWATKNNIRCSDGLVIMKNAFADQDGVTVPLVWMHQHDGPANVLGHAQLFNRNDGVYTKFCFNDTDNGKNAESLVNNGDVTALSIFANKLKKNGNAVMHGVIREVSLVLAGANPGAIIDGDFTDDLEHDGMSEADGVYIRFVDDEYDSSIEEYFDEGDDDTMNHSGMMNDEQELEHSDEATLGDVYNTLNDDQKMLFSYLLTEALNQNNEGANEMKHTLYDDNTNSTKAVALEEVLQHDDIKGIFKRANKNGSLKEAVRDVFEQHKDEFLAHGVTNLDYLFPETKYEGGIQFIDNPQEWVQAIMGKVHHSPTKKIGSQYSDLTGDEARARGYIKGTEKVDEQIEILRRSVEPTTVYKKQSFDRDDILDLEDFDIVQMIKGEMRTKLTEECARAILIGDGRGSSDPAKIKEDRIIPVWKDVDPFAIHVAVEYPAGATDADKAQLLIDAFIKAWREYRGAGSPDCFAAPGIIDDMLLLKDLNKHDLYESEAKVANKLRVNKIHTVYQMGGLTRQVGSKTHELAAIVLNFSDYAVGQARKDVPTMFDDFDIDYNKYKYLIETRFSGMLRTAKSALVFEFVQK